MFSLWVIIRNRRHEINFNKINLDPTWCRIRSCPTSCRPPGRCWSCRCSCWTRCSSCWCSRGRLASPAGSWCLKCGRKTVEVVHVSWYFYSNPTAVGLNRGLEIGVFINQGVIRIVTLIAGHLNAKEGRTYEEDSLGWYFLNPHFA